MVDNTSALRAMEMATLGNLIMYHHLFGEWSFPEGFGVKGTLDSGSIRYFFDGPNYIRVNRGLQGVGYVDEDYPWKIADVRDQ
jgi:hypothetical protein